MKSKEELAVQDFSNVRSTEVADRKHWLGIRVSSGAIAVGIFYTIAAVVAVVTCSYWAARFSKENIPVEPATYGSLTHNQAVEREQTAAALAGIAIFLIIGAVWSGLYCLLSISVVVGVMTNRPRLMQPWIVVQWIDLVLSGIGATICVLMSLVNGQGVAFIIQLLALSLIMGFKYMCLNFVRLHFQQLKNMNF